MVDTCFGGLTQTKSLIMHVKDGNGALKYRVVQDSSTGCLEKIFPCLGGGETVYGIHPVRPGATGAGLPAEYPAFAAPSPAGLSPAW